MRKTPPRPPSTSSSMLAQAQDLIDEDNSRGLWDDDDGPPRPGSPLSETSAQFAAQGDVEALEALLSASPSFDLDDPEAARGLPLHIACAAGQFDAARLLLSFGANPNALDRFGCAPLHRLPQAVLATRQAAGDITRLLISHGADLELRSGHGSTALMVACERGNFMAAQALHEAGADLWAKDGAGFTSVDLARSEDEHRRPRGPGRKAAFAEQRRLLTQWVDAMVELQELRSDADARPAPANGAARQRSL